MLEKSLGGIAAVTSAGRIGHAACSYGCAGCPLTRNAEAITVRVVGYNDSVFETIRRSVNESSGSGRFVELASGDIPADGDVLRKLHKGGVRRIVVPVFGLGEAHDRRVRVEGSFDKSMKVLEISHAVGLERMLIAPLGSNVTLDPPKIELSEERTLTRLAWKHKVALSWANIDHEPLCISDHFE